MARETEQLDAAARVLVFAPHADDDVLGCGATLAYAGRHGGTVHVLYGTDGAASHPRSRAYPAAALRALREREACEALRRLGHDPGRARFLRGPDGALGALDARATAAFSDALATALAQVEPTLVLLPWRRDPHPDHRAFAALARGALRAARTPARVLEYAVWLHERGAAADRPTAALRPVRFATSAADAARKRFAIAAHRSQTTALIDDDPSGFRLDPAMVERACAAPEIFYEEW